VNDSCLALGAERKEKRPGSFRNRGVAGLLLML